MTELLLAAWRTTKQRHTHVTSRFIEQALMIVSVNWFTSLASYCINAGVPCVGFSLVTCRSNNASFVLLARDS